MNLGRHTTTKVPFHTQSVSPIIKVSKVTEALNILSLCTSQMTTCQKGLSHFVFFAAAPQLGVFIKNDRFENSLFVIILSFVSSQQINRRPFMFQRNVWSHFNAVQMCNHTFLHKIPQLFVTLWCERQSSTRSLEETMSENMHCCLRAPTNVTCECASVPAIKPTKLAGKTRGVVSV